MSTTRGLVFDIGEGTVHDGPGLRVTVFLKGCPMRCRWCHSPESWSVQPQMLSFPDGRTRLAGEWRESDELAAYLREMAALLGPDGGITFTGGEPLMQADFLLDVLKRLPDIHTIVETTGCCQQETLLSIARHCSYIHYGLKLLSNETALFWTGHTPELPLQNLHALDAQSETPYCLRMPLIPGVVDSAENLRALQELTFTLTRLERIDFLPSNKMAPAKYASCGLQFDAPYDITADGAIPDWFAPRVPWSILE